MRPQKIDDLIKKGDIDQNIVSIIDRLMTHRFQQYSEILKMPVTLVDEILKRINKQIEQENKAVKK